VLGGLQDRQRDERVVIRGSFKGDLKVDLLGSTVHLNISPLQLQATSSLFGGSTESSESYSYSNGGLP
jgi:hypothetical protein